MEFYRAFVDAEVVCDLLVQLSLHDMPQHLTFARRERGKAHMQRFQPFTPGALAGIAVDRAFHRVDQIFLRRAFG